MQRVWYLAFLSAVTAGILIAPGLRRSVNEDKNIDSSKLEQMARQIMPEDQPEEAQEFFVLKRSPDRISPIPAERYQRAIRRARRMPRHSTPQDAMLPSEDAMGRTGAEQPEFLGSWTQLGPGNIGGRTRAIVIDPGTTTTMYAAGVAGGVWKTTNGGASWAPLTDLIADIAVNSLAMDPGNSNVIYAGTGEGYFNIDSVRGAGIFKTTDGGSTWASLANTAGFHYVNSIVVSPNSSSRIYAGTDAGVMRSIDGGSTWTNVLNPGLQGGCLDLVIRTDQTTDYLLASCGTFVQAKVFRNTDAAGAGTWNQVLSNTNQGLTSLAIAPSSQGVMYALAASNEAGNFHNGLLAVYQSTDGGGTWATRVSNTSATRLNTLLLTNPIIASLVKCGQGSQDQFFNQGWYDNVIAVDPADPNRVWAGGIDLFRSDDGGANWGLASNWWFGGPSLAHADQHAIVFQPGYNGTTNQTMFVGNDGGIFKTTNARAATTPDVCLGTLPSVIWTNLNNNYGATQFYYGVSFPSGTTYFGGTQDNGTDLGTDGGGIGGWSTILGGDGGAVAVDSSNTNVLYGENTGLSIQKTTTGPGGFLPATSGITEGGGDFLFIAPFIMDPSNSQRLWTGGFFLWRTTNGATSWTLASAVTPGNGAVSSIAVAPSNANMALAGLSDGFIVRTNIALTSTSATTWASAMPRAGYVAGLTFDPANANVAYAAYSTFNQNLGDNHLYKSTDGGATWTGIDGLGLTGLPDVPAHSVVVDPHNSARLYVGTDIGVFVSIDGGANWAREDTGFANAPTESLTINTVGPTSTLFAFTHGRGAWRVTIPSASTNPETVGIFAPSTNQFFLHFSNAGGPADLTFQYGPANSGWIPVVGDWTGQGIETVGLYNPATAFWFLKNSNSGGAADLVFQFGPPNSGWIPVVGDWDGNGTDTVGLYDPLTSVFFLKNSNSAGAADLVFQYGPANSGWTPLAGDWDGNGTDTVGLYNPTTSVFFLKNTNAGGAADLVFQYGPASSGWTPVIGDWNADGTVTIGLFVPSAANWFLRNTNSAGAADLVFNYGFSGVTPLSGRWH